MIKALSIFFTFMSFALVACQGEPGYHSKEYHEIKVEELSEDIKVPVKAWDLLEFKAVTAPAHGEALGEAHGEEAKAQEHGDGGGHGGGKAEKPANLAFAEVDVFLVQKNEGVVIGDAVKIALPRGGGTIDLSQFITDKKGTFYVGFDFPKFEEATGKRVLFVSATRKRRIENQVFGAGCNQVLDITTRFLNEMKGPGLKVNTTQERYLSVLGGSFLFSAQNGRDIHLAQVTFKNPAFAPLFCEEP